MKAKLLKEIRNNYRIVKILYRDGLNVGKPYLVLQKKTMFGKWENFNFVPHSDFTIYPYVNESIHSLLNTGDRVPKQMKRKKFVFLLLARHLFTGKAKIKKTFKL